MIILNVWLSHLNNQLSLRNDFLPIVWYMERPKLKALKVCRKVLKNIWALYNSISEISFFNTLFPKGSWTFGICPTDLKLLFLACNSMEIWNFKAWLRFLFHFVWYGMLNLHDFYLNLSFSKIGLNSVQKGQIFQKKINLVFDNKNKG